MRPITLPKKWGTSRLIACSRYSSMIVDSFVKDILCVQYDWIDAAP